jgi:hypothetical protein
MRLDARIARLEASGGGGLIPAAEINAAADRYADGHRSLGQAFPNAMSPADYRHALAAIRDPKHQRFMACWVPGDDDL